MRRMITLVYGAVGYAAFAIAFLYTIGFVGDIGVPKSIDGLQRSHFGESVLIDLALMALFAIQHSVMARQGFKAWWTRIVPKSVERSTFVLLSSLILALLFWQWRPLSGVVWSVENPIGAAILWALFALGWVIVLLATFNIGHFELFGMRQVILHLRGEAPEPPRFKEPGFYKLVRHPIMTGFIIAFWATPRMTLGHLLFAVVTTLYILVALRLEERDLEATLGTSYSDYKDRVPMLFPYGRRKS